MINKIAIKNITKNGRNIETIDMTIAINPSANETNILPIPPVAIVLAPLIEVVVS